MQYCNQPIFGSFLYVIANDKLWKNGTLIPKIKRALDDSDATIIKLYDACLIGTGYILILAKTDISNTMYTLIIIGYDTKCELTNISIDSYVKICRYGSGNQIAIIGYNTITSYILSFIPDPFIIINYSKINTSGRTLQCISGIFTYIYNDNPTKSMIRMITNSAETKSYGIANSLFLYDGINLVVDYYNNAILYYNMYTYLKSKTINLPANFGLVAGVHDGFNIICGYVNYPP